jgi:hypothetical protein
MRWSSTRQLHFPAGLSLLPPRFTRWFTVDAAFSSGHEQSGSVLRISDGKRKALLDYMSVHR